jgi:DNA modification methylase
MSRPDRVLFTLHRGDALAAYPRWPSPAAIISDGAYGIDAETAGDTLDGQELTRWYRPHITAWSAAARPDTTLWVWNTEIGFALAHSEFERLGWDYVQTIIWDKGTRGHVGWPGAKFRVVTECCTVYRQRGQKRGERSSASKRHHRPDVDSLTNIWPVPLLTQAERFSGSLPGTTERLTHPHQKPLEVMVRIIRAATDPGDVIWEPFAGAATASVAAVELSRRPFAAEHNPRFAELALQRLQATRPDRGQELTD